MKTFLILIILVVFFQILLLKPIIGQGLTVEDYFGFYSIRASKDTMFKNPIEYWVKIGIHDSAHNTYLRVLDILFGENYTMQIYFNIFFKITATLLLYPLVLLISKNKLLAFLGSFLYSISYSSVGALYLYVVGNEYLGVTLLNIFFIFYFLCIKKTSSLMLTLTSLSITLSFFVLPIRVFPVFAIVSFVEACILIKNKFSSFRPSMYRIIAIFLPNILIMLFYLKFSGTGAYDLQNLPIFLKRITDGNWFLLLYPLWGLGYTYLPVAYFHIFGKIDISNFFSYLSTLSHTYLIIFVPISVILSLFIPRKHFRFFSFLILVNLILDSLLFFFYTHHFSIPDNLVRKYSGPAFNSGLYAGLVATFVISIAIVCGLEWYLTAKTNKLLFLISISPFFALFFIICQWFFTRDYYMYQEGIHRYFVIPAIGSYLFIAGILTIIYQRNKLNKQFLCLCLIILVSFQIFNISKGEISQLFNGKKGSGRDLQIQKSLQNQTLNFINKDRLTHDMLFYIKLKSPIFEDANRWEDIFDWRDLTFWIPIRISYLLSTSIEGCTLLTVDYSELQKMAQIQSGSRGFLYKNGGNKEARCAHNGFNYVLDEKFILLDDFYAFRITDDLRVVNITDEIKNGLIFN